MSGNLGQQPPEKSRNEPRVLRRRRRQPPCAAAAAAAPLPVHRVGFRRRCLHWETADAPGGCARDTVL